LEFVWSLDFGVWNFPSWWHRPPAFGGSASEAAAAKPAKLPACASSVSGSVAILSFTVDIEAINQG
jgi:hypothetical protein